MQVLGSRASPGFLALLPMSSLAKALFSASPQPICNALVVLVERVGGDSRADLVRIDAQGTTNALTAHTLMNRATSTRAKVIILFVSSCDARSFVDLLVCPLCNYYDIDTVDRELKRITSETPPPLLYYRYLYPGK